jgi:hypothetical protein
MPAVEAPTNRMAEAPPHPELLVSLGRLVRGLSLLFWGLPLALVVCVQTAKGDWFRPLGVFPALLSTALLFYGLSLLGHFQKQERPWRAALDRVSLLALINVGLSPFLYWSSRMPAQPFFNIVVEALLLSGLLFLLLLNPMLCRLTSMLPDEMLRLETRLFTTVNRYLLLALFVCFAAYFTAVHLDSGLPAKAMGWLLQAAPLPQANALLFLLDRAKDLFTLFIVLLPVATTMALMWKIKEVILASVFGSEH